MKRMLVLYRELAGYFVNTMNHLANNCDFEIDIVAYPVMNDAPFRFEFSKNIFLFSRHDFNEQQLISLSEAKKYDLIFCGGWADGAYLSVVKHNRHVKSLLGFDKQWLGNTRDVLGAAYLRWKVTRYFDYAFVPGLEQKVFAKRAGFKENRVFTGAYTCETQRFSKVFDKRKQKIFSKQIVFAGRYAHEKQVEALWKCFLELLPEFPDWTLHCVGTGPLRATAVNHPHIIHHGFLQGTELEALMVEGDIFVLPSSYEPWGVVVNEFALAGFPLVLSNRVGARTSLLTDENGWVFQYNDIKSLKNVLKEAMSTPQEELARMGMTSNSLSAMLDEKQYAASILKMIETP
jgi:glycosyltransferase involved in cell wall biosynthesis